MQLLLKKYGIATVIILCFITRLPQLISPHLFLDGDECVVATMAKHLYEGKDFSIFFWGQKYGFTIIETLFILPFYALLGFSTLAVKSGILCLWTIGIIFFYKTIRLIVKDNAILCFIIVLFLITSPAWGVWSMKARGGYSTAFTLSSVSLFLLFAENLKPQIRFFLFGVFIALISESQVFFLVGLLPLFFYNVIFQKQLKYTLVSLIVIVIVFTILYFYKQSIKSTYTPFLSVPDETIWMERVARFPSYLLKSLQGQYYFSFFQPADFFTVVSSYIFTIGFFSLMVLGIYHLFTDFKKYKHFIVSSFFTVGVLAYSCFTAQEEGRYLLPVPLFIIVSFALYIKNVSIKKNSWIPLAAINAIGLIGLITLYNFQFETNKKQSIQELIAYLRKHDLKYTYATDCMLPWYITFYSNEKLLSRMPFIPGRYDEYHRIIDSAYFAGAPTAVIGYKRNPLEMHLKNLNYTSDFFIGINPPKEELLKVFYIKRVREY